MKKNECIIRELKNPGLQKVLRIMKLTTFLLLLSVITAFAGKSYSQTKLLNLDMKNSTVKEVLKNIEEQSEFVFMYSEKIIDVQREVSVNIEDQKINDVLDQLFAGTDVNYKVKDRFILLATPEVSGNDLMVQPQKSVSGTVTDESGQPLPGVTVTVKGTTQGTTTNTEGEYTIRNVSSDATLVFSFVGMRTQEIVVGNQMNINVTLLEDIFGIEEVVAIGYGTMKKANLTGSVSEIGNERLENRAVTNLSQSFSGQVPGVTVIQSSGEPGEDIGRILIRGEGTFSLAGTSPLVIVDGIPGNMNQIDPNMVESISVLKDAASAAIYGARAANGVILVTTKRGREGVMQVSYNGYLGWQRPTEFPDLVDSWTYAELKNEALVNTGSQPEFSNEVIQKMKDGVSPYEYNENHIKNLYYSGTGFQTNHNLNFIGGSEFTNYAASMSYLKQNGLVDENFLERYSLNFNLDQKVSENLTLKSSIYGVRNKTVEPIASAGNASKFVGRGTSVREFWKATMNLPPWVPEIYPDGSYGRHAYYTARGWLDSDSFGEQIDREFLGNIGLKWDIFNELAVSGNVGYRNIHGREKYFNAVMVLAPDYIDSPAKLREYYYNSETLTLQSFVEYNKKLGEHNILLLLGYSQESNMSENLYGYREDFPSNFLTVLDAGSSSLQRNSGGAGDWSLRSYFGRFHYSYQEKYLFEANARYDGSSRFRKGRRYGFFPSFSGGWIMSNEKFFQVPWISSLKLRGSWGELGNQNISLYPYQNTLSLGNDYLFGNQIQPGITLTSLANRDISWETTRIFDVGLDASFFRSRLNLTVDYFNKKTNDILYRIQTADVLGLSTGEQNAGEVLNRGLEFMLNHQNKLGEFEYSISANFSTLYNEVLNLANVERSITRLYGDYHVIMEVGQPINAFYDFKPDGLFVDQADIDSYAVQNRPVQPGDIRNMDISGPDGVPDGKVDATNDRTVLGSDIPKYTFGFNLGLKYKEFDFSALLQGQAGVRGIMRRWSGKPFYTRNLFQWQTERWTPENPDRWATVPRLTTDNTNWSDALGFWFFDASYLRVKDVQIGYTIPKTATNKLKINSLRIYLSGRNIITFDKYVPGFDPEAREEDNTYYPPTGIYTVGLNLKF